MSDATIPNSMMPDATMPDAAMSNPMMGDSNTVEPTFIADNAFIGDVGYGFNWAGFSHRNSANTAGYALLQYTSGIYTLINKRSGGGFIGFRVDNADKMVITDNGNVGIGSTFNPAKLTVDDPTGDTTWNTAAFRKTAIGPNWSHIHWGSTGDWYIRSAASTGNVVIQDTGGNVGVGTASPSAKLTVDDTSGNTTWNTAAFRKAAIGPNWSHIHWGSTGDWYIRSAASTGNVFIQDTGGSVGIGTTTPNRKLHVEGSEIHSGGGGAGFSFGNRQTAGFVESPANGERWVWYSTGGVARLWSGGDKVFVNTNGVVSATQFISSSSRELKENIAELSGQEAIATLENLNPVKYNYKADSDHNQHIGFIAEDVPALVATSDRKGLSAMDIVGVLTKALQEQQKTITALTQEVQLLKAQMA